MAEIGTAYRAPKALRLLIEQMERRPSDPSRVTVEVFRWPNTKALEKVPVYPIDGQWPEKWRG